MSKVGSFTITTFSGKIINEEVDVNVEDCFRSSVHPYRKVSQTIQSIIKKQDTIGDPVNSIATRHFATDDMIGDDDYNGIM